MIVQIYEVSTPEEAKAISAIGVDHIGVLVGPGEFPRELPLEAAKNIAFGILPGSKVLSAVPDGRPRIDPAVGAGAPAGHPAPRCGAGASVAGTDNHPEAPAAGCAGHAERARGGRRKHRDRPELRRLVDFLLLDSHRADDRQIGALGVTHDWLISRRIVEAVRTPVILAGGLGDDNVGDAIRTVGPAGVDSKTKTDRDASPGKDQRVRQFTETVRAARP